MSEKNITIAVASGKGGVGKSMFASGLAVELSKDKNLVAVDADVDAPNLHLWLGGVKEWDQKKSLSVTEKAKVLKADYDCQEFKVPCQFGAIKCENNNIKVNPFLCEGCGLCEQILPPGVVEMHKVVNGEVRMKEDIYGFPLVSGYLFPGETGSGKIVDEIIKLSQDYQAEITLIDIPAGIGCPVTAGLKEADLVILVTEPTPTGWSDLKRILKVVKRFNLPWRLVINKCDLDLDKTKKIEKWASTKLIGKIKYDQEIFRVLSELTPIVESNLEIKDELGEIYENVLKWVRDEGKNSGVNNKTS